MQFDPRDEASRYAHSHHPGTIASGGTVSLGDFGSEIAGFDGTYPFPAISPALDAIMPHATSTATVGAGDTTAGVGLSDPGGHDLFTTDANDTTAPASPMSLASAATKVLSGLTIVADYDSSISGLQLSSPALYTEVTGAITAAIQFLETSITNPMLITIDFGYGEVQGQPLDSGALGQSNANYYNNNSYGSIVNALSSHATSAAAIAAVSTLPASSPVAGATWDVPFSEMKALGLSAPSGLAALTPTSTEVDGWVGISSSFPFAYNPANRAVSGQYDAIGVLEHEITEDLGRVESLGTYVSIGNVGGYTPLDLFRYASPGVRDLTPGPGYFSINSGQTNLDTFNNPTNGNDAGDWASSVTHDSFDAIASSGAANTVSATDLTLMNVLGYSLAAPCYAAGTRILCAGGEVRVEDLAVGDMVFARSAGLVPVKWIGHRRIDCRRHPAPERVWPVCITAGAFGPNQPSRDLWLSPDHAVAVGDTLIPIRLLANGASIRQETGWRQVHYFHVELGRHDILLADGLAVESYLDTGNRGMFANAPTPLELHPWLDDAAAQSRRETLSCLPFCREPEQVRPVWHALAQRSEDLGLPLPAVAVTDHPELSIVVNTRRLAPIARNGDCYTFVVPAHADSIRLRSRHAVPAASRPWLGDTRRLGVAVYRISVRCGMSHFDVALDDPRLTDGWWDVERDAATTWRWTDGDAALPFADGPATIEVLVGGMSQYKLDGSERDAVPESASREYYQRA
jgi:hypothetical protein